MEGENCSVHLWRLSGVDFTMSLNYTKKRMVLIIDIYPHLSHGGISFSKRDGKRRFWVGFSHAF